MVVPQPLHGYRLSLYDLALVVNCNLAFFKRFRRADELIAFGILGVGKRSPYIDPARRRREHFIDEILLGLVLLPEV